MPSLHHFHFFAGLLLTSSITAASPWNVDALKAQTPSVTWLRRDQPVHSLLYEGLPFQGHPTDVFAFYATPATIGAEPASPGERFPAVVLIHGGGGTAFAEWVYLWAKRGYAAIAMDLAGSRPPDPLFDPETRAPKGHQSDANLRIRLERGGPNHGHVEKFDSIGGDRDDDWPYHAAANVIRAHNLVRSFPDVDPERTAVTGISWGGYTTCLVASLDDRFRAAVPVYGCGFLHEGESVQKPSIEKLGERAALWVKDYDPGSVLSQCRVPILFINGTHDVHYPLDSYLKSYRIVPGEKQMRIQLKMAHGHQPGWAPQEIGLFIDSKCRGGIPLPVPGEPATSGATVRVRVTVAPEAPLKSAQLCYTTDGGPRSQRNWVAIPAKVNGNEVIADAPPPEANIWYLEITDVRDAMVSTPVTNREMP